MRRRRATQCLMASVLGGTAALPEVFAQASAYPTKPVRIIIGFPPGTATDNLSRVIAEELRQALGQAFVIDGKPGASAQIAAASVAQSPPDGYTLLITSNSSHSVNPHIVKKMPYDAIADFQPLGAIAYLPFIVAVNSDLPIKTLRELVAYAQANRGKVNYAYGATAIQIVAETLNKQANMGAVGVPYKGNPAALIDVIAGRAQFLVSELSSARPHLQSGRLRALAVTTAKRSVLAPELPTVTEAINLPDFDMAAWVGMFGPAGMPRDVTQRLSSTLVQILNRPAVRDRMLSLGAEVTPMDSTAFAAYVKQQLDMWGRNVAIAGIQPE